MAETDTTQQQQEPKPREGGEAPPREGGPRESSPREGGPREGGPREGGPREGGLREGGPREGGPREGAPREGGKREGGPREGGRREGGDRGGGREGRGGHGGERREGGGRGEERRGGDRGRFEGPPEIDLEKLISDPLYLDNQAHGVVSRMRDMDSGTKSQLRRLYNAVRRAVRAPESERQQQFVMLRARLAYTIARHSLRSLDSLEKLLLQVTRKNDARGYERFRDLFEAIVAYNE
ncbi:MAG TPA: type III-A CRISPR-associated protein Csm2 [Bryobacteraceae bacterium]|nr:type III-A CRISPR-associated protein Csm2 [Bryobacteraceae bacterium]